METFTAQDMQDNGRVLRESAMSEPVIIMSDDRPSLVLMSMQEYDRLRGRRRIVGSAGELSDGLIASLDALAGPEDSESFAKDQPADGPRS
jgi:PHD/YefM family antitoxin component YafN of YafNO toxin-antitoxin module